MVTFEEFLKTWSLRSSSVTRQVNFNWTKIGWKRRHNWKSQMRHFLVIFKHSDVKHKLSSYTTFQKLSLNNVPNGGLGVFFVHVLYSTECRSI